MKKKKKSNEKFLKKEIQIKTKKINDAIIQRLTNDNVPRPIDPVWQYHSLNAMSR